MLRVILDRPDKHNAQTPATWDALTALGDDLPEGIRVVVLSGNGPSFSAGLDRRMFAEGIPGQPSLLDLAGQPAEEVDGTIAHFQRAFTWWRERPVVTIAVVHGHAIGAGFQLALACDIMLVGHSALLTMKEIQLGLVPDLGGTLPLVRAVGYQRALELCLTGRSVNGQEAADLGIALACVNDDELAAASDDLVAAITAAMPHATSAVLELLRGAHGRNLAEQTAAERRAQYGRITELAALMEG
ncbi:MAG: Enoyl-CoA hydratase/isomerase family protein [Actinomycetota bacterium]|nr:Enoyl-CoA hydratase/isomerase family protein [Actinomycetota bacterium]